MAILYYTTDGFTTTSRVVTGSINRFHWSQAMPINNKTEERLKAARIRLAREPSAAGFAAFCELVLRDDTTNQPIHLTPHQREWIEFLFEDFDWPWLFGERQIYQGRQKMILACFKHGKSPIIARGLPCWLLGHNRNLRQMVVCNSTENATNRALSVGRLIEQNQEFKQIFPDIQPDKSRAWNSQQLNVVRETNPNDHSLQSFSMDSKNTGLTIDIFLGDDLIDEEDQVSEAKRTGRIRKFYNSWLSRLRPGGGMVIVFGTKWHPLDLYQTMLAEDVTESNWDVLVQGVSEDTTHIEQPPPSYKSFTNVANGDAPKKIPLWVHMPKKELERRKRNDARAYRAGFQQLPQTSDAENIFDEAAVKRMFRWDVAWQDLVPNRDGKPLWPTYQGVDLSGKTRKGTILFTVSVDPATRIRVVLNIRRLKSGFGPVTADEVYKDYEAYNLDRIAVESNAAQEALIEWITDKFGVDFPAYASHTGKDKIDPEFGVPGLALDVNRDVWICPMLDIITHKKKADFCSCGRCTFRRELKSYPVGTYDTIMAGMHANRAIGKYRQFTTTAPNLFPIRDTLREMRSGGSAVSGMARPQSLFGGGGSRIFGGRGKRIF